MISITNNGASIQLNGDQNVTIVKRDVTKVQAIGINVLVVRNTNGVERKTAIPYTSVNSPSTYPTAQALADYISSILGNIDTTSFIENSNLTYVAQVTSSPFPIPDTDLEVNGNAFVSLPSADPTAFDISVENTAGADVGLIIGSTIEIGDTQIEISGVNEGSVPAETTAEIDIEDNLGNPITPASVIKTGNTFLATLPPALDATAVLKDTASNIISTTNIPSGVTDDIIAPDGSIRNSNSDDSYVNDVSVRSGQLLKANELPDITLVVNDQNGNNLLNVTRPSVKNLTETVTVPQILTWELNYNGTDDVIYIPATASNVGTLNSGTGSNVGTITVSTDGITYGALSFPFTPINGTTYYFKRGTASVNGTYTMVGTYV